MKNKYYMSRLALRPCLKSLFLLLLMFLLLVALLFLLGMPKREGPKSPLKKFMTRISIHGEKWLEFYAGRGHTQCAIDSK